MLEENTCLVSFLQVEEPYLHFGVQCHMHWHSRQGRQHTTTHCSNWQTHCMRQGANGEHCMHYLHRLFHSCLLGCTVYTVHVLNLLLILYRSALHTLM